MIIASTPHECVGRGRLGRLLCSACAEGLPNSVAHCYRCQGAHVVLVDDVITAGATLEAAAAALKAAGAKKIEVVCLRRPKASLYPAFLLYLPLLRRGVRAV